MSTVKIGNKKAFLLSPDTFVDGVFVDLSNDLGVTFTFDSNEHTWTATEDCIIGWRLIAIDSGTSSYIIVSDGTNELALFSTYENQHGAGGWAVIKKGQIVKYKAKGSTSGFISTMTAYGIQRGSASGNIGTVRELTYAEYNALSESEKMNGTEYYIKDINGDGSQFQPVIYSLEEREIGVWTDGRPLYEKTVDFGALPNNTTKTVSYNISDLDYFVKIQCVAHNQNGARNIPFVDDAKKTGDVLLDTIKTSGVIRIIAHTDLSSLTGDVTLQYVKTTDTAGSGTWTPQGVPAVHYSTDEHVVGTWIDGSTLYEKTYDFSSNYIDIPSGASWTTTDIDSSNIGTITNVFANHSDGTMYNDMSADPTGNNHTKLKLKSSGGASAFYLTLQYTKSSS